MRTRCRLPHFPQRRAFMVGRIVGSLENGGNSARDVSHLVRIRSSSVGPKTFGYPAMISAFESNRDGLLLLVVRREERRQLR
jgi:hypothetical protein